MPSETMTPRRILLLGLVVIISFEEFINAQDATKIQQAKDKCDEYSKLAQSGLNVPQCDHPKEPLIVGSKAVQTGEFPHMAGIGFKDENNEISWNCGGTLISERFVLTAAHCTTFQSGIPIKVRLWGININQYQPTGEDFDIADIIRHPDYSSSTLYNDLALLKLARDVVISKKVRPACLWQDYNIGSENAIATGLAKMEHGVPKSEKRLQVTLKFFETERCKKIVGTGKELPTGIKDNMICAGHVEGGEDTCNANSGSPLVITKDDNHCVFYVVGVTSFGSHCPTLNTPSVYIRVSSFVEWIVDTIW